MLICSTKLGVNSCYVTSVFICIKVCCKENTTILNCTYQPAGCYFFSQKQAYVSCKQSCITFLTSRFPTSNEQPSVPLARLHDKEILLAFRFEQITRSGIGSTTMTVAYFSNKSSLLIGS